MSLFTQESVQNTNNTMENEPFCQNTSNTDQDDVAAIQAEIRQYANELAQKIRENPLKALLIAGGVGLLLSNMLKK